MTTGHAVLLLAQAGARRPAGEEADGPAKEVQQIEVPCAPVEEEAPRSPRPALAGLLCCPIGTIFAHEGFRRHNKVFLGPVIIFFLYLFYESAVMRRLERFVEEHRYVHTGAAAREELMRAKEEVLDYYYTATWLFFGLVAVITIGTVVYAVKFWQPKKRLMNGPGVVGLCCCPLATVFYWEGSRCSLPCVLASVFGFLYALPFYSPPQDHDYLPL